MKTIDDYLELAKEKQGLKSDRQLGRALEFKSQSISFWRHRKTIPSDENMVELAKLAGEDPETALLELAYWRTCSRNEHAAAQVFLRMASRAAPALLAAMIAWTPSQSEARQIQNIPTVQGDGMYIMLNYLELTTQCKVQWIISHARRLQR